VLGHLDHAEDRGADFLIARQPFNGQNWGENFMFRTRVGIVAAVMMSAMIAAAPAQTPAPAPAPAATAPAAAAPAPKKSRLTLTREKIKDMRAKWKANRPKLKACRAEVKKKGLVGDDRWFFISECMEKA
jgi:hypothetical protein